MRTTLNQILAVVGCVVALAVQDASAQGQLSPVRATLTVPDDGLLPGVPFDMWIDVHNPSDTTVTIGLFPYLVVTTDRGEAFTVRPSDPPELLPRPEGSSYLGMDRLLELPPGARQTLTVPIGRGPVGFFGDERLSPPGGYTISIRLDAFPGGLETFRPPLTWFGPVTTNEVRLDRVEPSGSDAQVWNRMQEFTKGHWAPRCWQSMSSLLIAEIFEKYAESNYVPYALVLEPGRGTAYQNRVLDALTRFPDTPVAELLHVVARDALRFGDSIGLEAYHREEAIVSASRRPTTRIRVFGREDVPRQRCPKHDDCED
ncbi:MAG: hypothetical protein NDJ92_19690 [Thermoanaerobaculia bacterium]|nr:hypothetical protein [Thermoanaerobaculia bacterium]